MRRRNKGFLAIVLLLAAVLLVACCTADASEIAKKKKNTATPPAVETAAAQATPNRAKPALRHHGAGGSASGADSGLTTAPGRGCLQLGQYCASSAQVLPQ